jgi:hypothetical protein
MVAHGQTWTSDVACTSVSLPLRDQLRSRGYARPKPRLSTSLLIASPPIDCFREVQGGVYQGLSVAVGCCGQIRTRRNCNPL